ncbi:CHAT domain-containing protein [Gymnopilus junonius]|uniref:CHAT domain-containing protein n=1 Tax=Gymnopilus junonius TaxID=109634 RepID=A0A9P5P0V5_GYMJU|nr:CHAT domain-containing protein [Gymnopilus junonius]
MPDDRAGKWSCLNDLAVALQNRYHRKGTIVDISDAILVQHKAIRLIPDGDHRLPALLSNLGNMFILRSTVTANASDISEGISAHQRAVQLTPDGDESMAQHLTCLGNAYEQRSTLGSKGDVADITLAISYHKKAVQSLPQGHENLPVMLNSLMTSLLSRYYRKGDVTDLTEAIAVEQRAIKITPLGHPNRHMWLSNLGILLHIKFEHSTDPADISKAIELQRKAIQLAIASHKQIPMYYNLLAKGLGTRYKAGKDSKDISEGISLLQDTLKRIPNGHVKKGDMFIDLGRMLRIRFQDSGDSKDILEAVSQFRLAALYTAARPSIRLEAARMWSSLSEELDSSQTLDAHGVVIQQLSQVAGIEQSITMRHEKLSDISDLSIAATAFAISSEEFETAVEWLEQGRCIVWRQLNTLRNPMDDLRAYDPELANRLSHLSRSIEDADSLTNLGVIKHTATLTERITIQEEVTARLKLIQEWNKLLKEVRNIPAFRNFLLPRPCSEILSDIPDGMVIVINVHSSRCDALALIAGVDVPVHIALNNFSYKKAEELRTRLQAYLTWHGVRMRDTGTSVKEETVSRGMRPEQVRSEHESILHEVLHDLWLYVVKPILDGLAISRPTPDPSRIWWCATGPLAFLPIHAAGIYGRDKKVPASCLSDYAISSYTPTIATLLESKMKMAKGFTQCETNKLLMISQPDTPHLPPIPGTTREILAIEKLLEGTGITALCLERDVASKGRVLQEMERHGWIHLACHAVQELNNSLESRFYLAGTQCLELSEIIKKNLPHAKFAFLSACQTSTGNEKLAEEAVHLAGGMLAAGYLSVVATMWSIQDCYGPEIASSFYSHILISANGADLDSTAAASALHAATQKLRKTLGDTEASLLAWVPYVHMGF